MVKLETTKDRRRLHIGSMFVDLNETDYRELIRIFATIFEQLAEMESKNLKQTDVCSNATLGVALPTRCINEDLIHRGYLDKCRNQNVCELCRQ